MGIIYGGDLFTLIPAEMGDPRGWMHIQDYIWFDDKIECQKEFLKLAVGEAKVNEDMIINSDKDCDIWFYSNGDGGACNNGLLLLKTDSACNLELDFGKASPAAIAVVDAGNGMAEIMSIPFEKGGRVVIVEIEDWMTYYWIRIKFDL